MTYNNDFAKFSPPPPQKFPPDWEQDIPYADEWGIPFDSFQEQDLDVDEGIPRSPQPVAPPSQPNPDPYQHRPQAPTTLPATIEEHLDNLFNWPVLSPNMTTVARPPTTSAQLRTFREKKNIHVISLHEGQYASHVLGFRQIMNVALEGGCGTGKSTLAMGHKHFVIFIAPTTVIIDQLASDDCQVIKANIEPNFEKYQRFASTYDSLPRLTAAAKAAGLNPYLIPIIVDEAQHFSSDGYKQKPLDACMFELRKFDNVTMTSATLPPYIPYFEHLPKMIIKRENEPTIKWSYVIGSDIAWIESQLTGGETILYHLNDKKKIDVVGEHIHELGFTWEHIDADNKDEMMANGLENKRLPNANMYMCTSVFNDGISVHEHATHYIIVISEQSARHLRPYDIYQFARRFRDNKPVHVYIMRKTNEFNDDVVFTEEMYKSMYERLVARTEKQVARLNREYQEEVQWLNEASKDFLLNSQQILERLFPIRDDSFMRFNEEARTIEVNLRAISEFVDAHLRSICHSSRYMMQLWLDKYGLEFCEIIEAEKESELEREILTTSKNLSNDEREIMRSKIANFETINDVYDASKATPPLTYTQASELLPLDQFVKERGLEGQEPQVVKEEYRWALREKVKEAHIKQKAAEILRQHVSTVYESNPGAKPETVLAIAKGELTSSTLTGKALKHLKHGQLLRAIAKGVHNPKLTKVLESAFITEVLKGVEEGIPILESEINATFEQSFSYSERARKRFTVVPRAKKGAELTEEDVTRAAKKQWKKRKEFLNYFFEMKSKRIATDGDRQVVWTPTKALCNSLSSAFARAIMMDIIIGEPLVESEVNATFERHFHLSEQARNALTITPKSSSNCEPTAKEIEDAANAQWILRREFIGCFFEMKGKRVRKNGLRFHVWTPVKALH